MLKKKSAYLANLIFFPLSIMYKTEGNFVVLQELHKNTLGYNKYRNIGENDPSLMEISNCLCSIIVYSDANCIKLLPLL